MNEFDTIEELFGWFIDNVYPTLTSEQKKKIKDAKYEFTKRGNISNKRMRRILEIHGQIKIIYHMNR